MSGHSIPSSRPRKRSINIAGHSTSVSLEEAFWQALQDLAQERGIGVTTLITQIDAARGEESLSGAIRVHILKHYRDIAKP